MALPLWRSGCLCWEAEGRGTACTLLCGKMEDFHTKCRAEAQGPLFPLLLQTKHSLET